VPTVGELLRWPHAPRAALLTKGLAPRLLRKLPDDSITKGWAAMLKCFCTTLAVVLLSVNGVARAAAPVGAGEQKVTEAENREAREVVIQFTKRFAETRDLTPIVSELYFSDFIERYKTSQAEDAGSNGVERFFVPGLDYNVRLLKEAGTEDWRRFYIAANDLLLLGLVALMKNRPDVEGEEAPDIKPTDAYPQSVITLLDKNPNLSNMILRKGQLRAVGTPEEMRAATSTMEQAVAIMRQALPAKPFGDDDKDWLDAVKEMKEDKLFKPEVVDTDEEHFGFPKGTRILIVKTPLGLYLMLARDNNRLKIFWTAPIAD
jgi:hypothetical protein